MSSLIASNILDRILVNSFEDGHLTACELARVLRLMVSLWKRSKYCHCLMSLKFETEIPAKHFISKGKLFPPLYRLNR